MPQTTTRLVDLDEVLIPDKKVTLAGRTYILPGDAPIEVVMRHQALVDAGAMTSDDVDRMHADILKLFRYKKPTLDRIPGLSRGQLMMLVRTVYIANGEARDLINLDLIDDQTPKRVKLAGKTYQLPPDLPAELWLRINSFSVQNHTDSEVLKHLYQSVLELFQIADPKITDLQIGVGSLIRAINRIYNAPADDAAPPPRPTGKPRATAGRKKAGVPASRKPTSTKSSSRTSSAT